jgi:hypothetical protein
MKCLFLALILLISPTHAFAYEQEYEGLLSAYVKKIEKPFMYNSLDYDAWSHDATHIKLRNKIQKIKIDDFKTDEEKSAFLINAYNFFIIDLIIQKGERDSIRDLDGAQPTEQRYKWSIGNKTYTLQDIEDQLWALTKNPNIYFALSCAAKSCPDIRAEPYRAKDLNTQLNDQMKLFLQNKDKGFQNIPNLNAVKISRLFLTKENHFNNGNIRPWLQPMFPLLVDIGTKIEYLHFDWSLNNKP